VETLELYWSRLQELSPKTQQHFFVYESGKPLEDSRKLSELYLVPYIRRMGIPHPYTPYSIKTAVITDLFNHGFSKEQVSAFTGHSSNSNTPLKHYFDSTNNWLGHTLGNTEADAVGTEVSEGSEGSEEEGESDN
jgi:site-specific recombinase XerD